MCIFRTEIAARLRYLVEAFDASMTRNDRTLSVHGWNGDGSTGTVGRQWSRTSSHRCSQPAEHDLSACSYWSLKDEEKINVSFQ